CDRQSLFLCRVQQQGHSLVVEIALRPPTYNKAADAGLLRPAQLLLDHLGIMTIVSAETRVMRRAANLFIGLIDFFPMAPTSTDRWIAVPAIVKSQYLFRRLPPTHFASLTQQLVLIGSRTTLVDEQKTEQGSH